MEYKSNLDDVLRALADCKHEFLERIGELAVDEAKSLATVLTGAMKRGIASDVMPNDEGVIVGDIEKYSLYVEKGIGQTAQPFLEKGCISSVPKIQTLGNSLYQEKFGGG